MPNLGTMLLMASAVVVLAMENSFEQRHYYPKLCVRRLERSLRIQRVIAKPNDCEMLIQKYELENVGFEKEIDPLDALKACCENKCPFGMLKAIGCLLQ